jgi:hypothetical protein
MYSIYDPLLEALEAQASGDTTAATRVSEIARQVCATHVFRDGVLTAAQVSAIERLLREWTDMFSFAPGRPDCLEVVIAILREIRGRANDADLQLHQSQSWIRLMALRGPGTDVVLKTCGSCRTKYVSLIFGSFSDGGEVVLACDACGHILVDPNATQTSFRCMCGGVLHKACPRCGGEKCQTQWLARPYEYFRTHSFEVRDIAG